VTEIRTAKFDFGDRVIACAEQVAIAIVNEIEAANSGIDIISAIDL
jgi:hypothetical protein